MNDQDKCQKCKEQFYWGEMYEYRGFIFCEGCFKEGCKLVDKKRERVMEITERSISSQRKGEFINNRSKYHLGNVAEDGLPRIKPNEPQILKDYENGIL